MGLKIHVIPCLTDNYGFLAIDEAAGQIACIDTPQAARIIAAVEDLGLHGIDVVLNTHWHPDHGGGNAEVRDRFGCPIFGPAEVAKHWPLDHVVEPGDVYSLGETRLDVIDLEGHTLGHIGYVDGKGGNAFIGDTLFPLGCGRLFEGTREQMWGSLLRLSELPADTVLYSAHEYTLASLRFAESLGETPALQARAAKIRRMREDGLATVPSLISEEIATNPFLYYPLREKDFGAQAAKFGELRKAKDVF